MNIRKVLVNLSCLVLIIFLTLYIVVANRFLSLDNYGLSGPFIYPLGKTFPDIEITDHLGNKRHLSSFKGKPIIIELSAFSCPATQAFSGAHKYGSFENIEPQYGLPSIPVVFANSGDKTYIQNLDIEYIQLLVFNTNMTLPTVAEAKSWYEHFHFDKIPNHHVYIAPKEFAVNEMQPRIPGFYLIDKNFKLRLQIVRPEDHALILTKLMPSLAALIRE